MNFKILHTGDLHIGMRFGNYPEYVRSKLSQARISTLKNIVLEANSRECDLLVIAGDMFEGHRVARETVINTASVLNGFNGLVLVLPGNHDYYDDVLWPTFERNMDPNKAMLLKDAKPYDLEPWGVDVVVYPAPCHARHSDANNLAWISQHDIDSNRFNLGVAHGTLAGLSPDLDSTYFPMTEGELRATDLDLWLLGHAHIPYPHQDKTQGEIIFNAGTPEPDGMNYRGLGSVWLLECTQGTIQGQRLTTGQYRFLDLEYDLARDFSPIEQDLLVDGGDKFVVRLTLRGSLEDEVLAQRPGFVAKLQEHLFYVDIDDTRVGRRISREILDQEFSAQSFPYRMLSKLSEDNEALQIAYELIRGVKKA